MGKSLGLPQTKGTFQMKGKVTGVSKDSFYSDKPTRTNKPMRKVNFGIQVNENDIIYASLQGMEREFAYFSKQEEKDGGKKETIIEKVAWKDRFKFNKEGFRLIGVNLGVSKTQDEKGNQINDKKNMTEFDACLEISNNLKDQQSVFTKGNIDYSHFQDNSGNMKRAVKFIPTQISLCKNDIDFEAEDFETMSDFTQQIIYNGIKKDGDRFVVDAKIVTYNSVEDAEYIIINPSLANTFKKGLKSYNSIKVWGNIVNTTDITQVTDDNDVWGDSNNMDRINTPTKRELIITGADGGNIDKDTYSEEIIEEAYAKMNADDNADKEYGNKDTWGNDESSNLNDDEGWD